MTAAIAIVLALAVLCALAVALVLVRASTPNHRSAPPPPLPLEVAGGVLATPPEAGEILLAGLRTTPDLLAFAADGVDAPVIIFNVGGALAAYGVEEGGSRGTPLRAFHPDGGEVWESAMRVLKTGVSETVPNSYDTPATGERHYLTTFCRITHHERTVLVAFAVDVTAIEARAVRAEGAAEAARAAERAARDAAAIANARAQDIAAAYRVPTLDLIVSPL